ncbi:hypothetical protein COU79_01410 [Candidatus Peregrinibacteria bacterium CG10_big_fil_rev_8_21_14_0_10_54_7]|nr:MAG: hypothetical protein COU79_01410 [Candidatus Peregrinibacteria bacterium CG10_big_fil_rev_8_21_14_0_10_54_7]
MRPPVEVAQTEPPDVRVDVPNILPPGAVDLLGEDLEALIKKGFVARERWQVKNKEGQLKLLQGSSGTHAWVAAINLPLSAESQKVIQSGQYAFRFVFKRTANGRWPDGMQGVTAFAVPLPNGRSISLYWDGNMDKKAAGAYRSGFDLEGTSFFSSQRRDTAAFGDHQQPVITEDGREYMCLVTVRVVPGGMAIDAQIAGNGDSKPLAHVSLAAPPTVSGDPLLFENKEKKRMPAQAGAPWALGVGGGSVELLDGHVIPLQKNGRKR